MQIGSKIEKGRKYTSAVYPKAIWTKQSVKIYSRIVCAPDCLCADKTAEAQSENGLLLFPNTYKNISQVTSKPYTVDADQRNLIQTNVMNYFGVSQEAMQNKLVGDSWSAFYEGSIEPFAVQFSEAMTKAMFTLREQSQGSYVMATANRLQYMSNSDKLQVSAQMADRGIMTRNEIREIWNLPPIEGGDVPTIRGEYYLINEDGNIVKSGEEGESNANEE